MPVYRATVDLSFAAGAGRGTNTWAIRTVDVGPAELANIQDLMARVQTFYTSLAALFPTNSKFSWDGTVQELGVPDPAFRDPVSPWTVSGSGAASSYAPAPAMVCVTWRTSLATRSGRGRTFLGPLSPGAFGTDGTVQDGNLDAIRDAATALADGNGALEAGALVVWSGTDGVGRDIIGASVSDQAAVLRSRR